MPVLALLPFIFTNIYIAAVMNAVIAFSFYLAVAYLGGKLFGTDAPEAKSGPTADSQSRSWKPHSTQQEGIARPRAWGKNIHHGNIVAKWTDVVDDREVLYMIVEHGDGPTKGVVYVDSVPQVFLNDQPVTNFTSVAIQERLGTFNQTCMTGFEKTKLEYKQNNELKYNVPVIVTTHNDFFDDIEYTIMGPNGLMKYQKDGDRKASAVGLRVRISVHGEDDWTTIFNENISGFKLHAWFKLYKVSEQGFDCVRGTQYDLEVMKSSGDDPKRHINDIYFRSFREVVEVGFKRPGKALVGIRAVATEALSGRIDVKVIREDRLIWTWNGTVGTIEYCRNRAWVAWDALTQPVISGDGNGGGPFTIEHFEGFSPACLDLDFFYAWAVYCSAQVPSGYPEPDNLEDRMACDTILDFHTDVWSFIQELANIGRAHIYWSDTLTGWIDTTVAAVSGLVTMDNVMARSWKNAWSQPSELAGKVEVFFQDSRQGYERMPAALPNESAGPYTRIISIEGVGIITRGTAIHVANHALKRNELIRNVNSFRQYKDGFRYKPGNTINIQHKTPDWGSGYRVVKSTAANKVTLDRTCTAEVDDLLFMQSYDTALKKVRVDSYTVSAVVGKVVTITGTWDVTPVKNYMCAIGVDGDIQTRRIIKMDLRSDNYFDITVETYDVALFTADDMVPDNPAQSYIWDKPANPLTRPVTHAEVVEIIHQVMIPQPDVDSPQTSNCTWTGSGGDTVSWSKTDADEPIQFRYKGTTYEIAPDGTTDEFIYWDPVISTAEFQSTDDASVAVALGKWYMCRNVAGVAWPAVPFSSIHAGVLQAGSITAAYGQIGALTVNTLEIIDEAVSILTAAQDDDWWYLDPSPLSQAGYGLYRIAVWTAEFTSSGAPCQVVFDTSVDGVNLTFVSKAIHSIFRTHEDYAELSISTIALVGTNTVKVTTTAAHNLDTDDYVWLWDILGTIELNDAICKVTVINGTQFALQLTRSDWFTAYTLGGKVRHVNLWGIRYGFFHHAHDSPVHVSLFDDFLEADKVYQYIGATRNRNSSEYAYINEGSTIIALETKK